MGSIAHPARLETLAWEAAVKIRRSEEYKTSAAILLTACKRRIEAGEPEACGLTWRQYCRVHLPNYPPSYLDRVIGWRPGDFEDESSVAVSTDGFDTAWAAFISLSLARQREFLHCGVAYTMRAQNDEAPTAAPCDQLAPEAHALDYQV